MLPSPFLLEFGFGNALVLLRVLFCILAVEFFLFALCQSWLFHDLAVQLLNC